MAWTQARVNELKRLWADGVSGSQIGERLGVSRHAVISKVHRLGLPGRATRSSRQYASRRVPPPVRPAALAYTLPLLEQMGRLTDFSCRWPLGDPREPDFRFCCAAVSGSSPYCEFHRRAAYQPASRPAAARRAA